ncbi:winged helix-turn-helix domain-containing tetratricopeptide repeat protein [Variovorax soli]|uniref:winged helix-turn-helix domain-containing tetratricopeptide repeat protein n=1 Tax=Variovorax soli TaxID=376815 RepID=UPI000A010DD8|nr:winged helix-turn-helix domain-containing protein [Variovorax soli]
MHAAPSHPRPQGHSPPEAAPDGAGGADVLRFSDFEFDPAREQLRRGGALVPLSPKPTALLRYFLRNPGRLISKQELMESIWGDVVVTDDSLVQCVGELRSRLGAQGAELITTHPRRGYMFEALVVRAAPARQGAAAAAAALGQPAMTPAPSRVPAPAPATAQRRRWQYLAAFLAAWLLVLAGAGVYIRSRPAPLRLDEEYANRYSIAVLPFQDIGSTPSPERIREDLPNEIAAQLSNLNMRVIRSAQPEGVRHAMTGTLATSGTRLVIDLQVRSIPQGQVIWTERLDFPDVTEAGVGLDAAQQAVGSLRVRYRDLHRERMNSPGFRPDAVDLMVAGWGDLDLRQSVEDVARARARLEAALRVDPDSVGALTGLGAALMSERFGYSGEPLPADPGESERVAERAIILAPENNIALINWANVQLFRNRPDLALQFFERAALNQPANANARVRYAAALMYMGRLDDAQAQCEAALKIGKRSPRVSASAWGMLSNLAFVRGDDDTAYAMAQRAVAQRPTYGLAYANLAAVDIVQGRPEEARSHMAEHLRLMPTSSASRQLTNNPAGSEIYRAGRDRLIAAMREAGLPEN